MQSTGLSKSNRRGQVGFDVASHLTKTTHLMDVALRQERGSDVTGAQPELVASIPSTDVIGRCKFTIRQLAPAVNWLWDLSARQEVW
jgi:hypothetical protein